MSTAASWHPSLRLSSSHSQVNSACEAGPTTAVDYPPEPDPGFRSAEDFFTVPGEKGWFCGICVASRDTQLRFFDPASALAHERSAAHQDAVAFSTTWGAVRVDSWGRVVQPYERLRYDLTRDKEPLGIRVRRWMRDMAKAEGIELAEEEVPEEVEPVPHVTWDGWASEAHDWVAAATAGMNVDPAADVSDPRATADFRFVERVARARGTKDPRRLHAFFRLPTEEKISRIQEIVHFISCH